MSWKSWQSPVAAPNFLAFVSRHPTPCPSARHILGESSYTGQLNTPKAMLAPGLFGAARRMGSSLFTSISPATCTAAPGGIISGLFAGRAGAEIGMGLTGAGPLMFVRGMAKKGGRVQDRRVRMSLSPLI